MTLRASLIAAALVLTAPATLAQSVYGCSDLDGRHSLPSVEGADGIFFHVDPDLMMFHPFSDETAQDMSALSQALASRGTTLIYVPLPTKALAMPEHLPQAARDHGFEATVAARRCRDRGCHRCNPGLCRLAAQPLCHAGGSHAGGRPGHAGLAQPQHAAAPLHRHPARGDCRRFCHRTAGRRRPRWQRDLWRRWGRGRNCAARDGLGG